MRIADITTGARRGGRAWILRRPPWLREARSLLLRAATHPGWMPDTIRSLRHRRAAEARPQRFPIEAYRHLVDSPAAALAALLGMPEHRSRDVITSLWMPADIDDDRPDWNASRPLMELTGGAVRLLAPQVVIETGVARGFTTACILAALEANGAGHLHSIDLPPLGIDAHGFTGQAVPCRLRHRWTLYRGPSRRLLPRLLARVGALDLFLHDADHAYEAQQEEYRKVWPYLRSGGMLISDDIANPAFLEFAAETGTRPYLIEQPGKPFPAGVLMRP